MANRVTQVSPEVVVNPTDSKARVSQLAPEILLSGTDADARVSQIVIEVLQKAPIIVTATAGSAAESVVKVLKTFPTPEESALKTAIGSHIVPFEAKGRLLVGRIGNEEIRAKVSRALATPENSWGGVSTASVASHVFPQESRGGIFQTARPKQESLGPASPGTSNSALSFTVTEGSPDPPSQNITVTNTGGGPLSFTASSDSGWLTVSPTSGTAPATLAISVAQAGLNPGTYIGRITVTGPSGTSTTSVTFNILGPSFLFLNDTSGQTWKVGVLDVGELDQAVQVPHETSSPSTINGPNTSWLVGITTNGKVTTTAQTFNNANPTFIAMESPSFIVFHLQVADDGELYMVAQLGSPGSGSPPVTVGPGGQESYVVSRYAAMARVQYPLVPPQPSKWEVNESVITFPKFHILLPPDTRDIFGILVQDKRTLLNATGVAITVVSDTAGDTRGVLVVGQDANGNYMEERLTLNGTAPVTTTKLFAYILWVNSFYGTVLNEAPSPLPDGQVQIFTTAKTPVPGSITAYLNGNPQTLGIDFNSTTNPTTDVMAFINPPPNGSQILVSYIFLENPLATLTISQAAGPVLGQILPGALQWLSNPILYRYEDLSLGSSDTDPALYFTLANIPDTGGIVGVPIVPATNNPPGLNFFNPSAGILAVGGATEAANTVTLKLIEQLGQAYTGVVVHVAGVGGGGPSEPAWNQTPGGITPNDGTISTWQNRGPIGVWKPNSQYANATTGPFDNATPCIIYDDATKTCYLQSNSNPGLRQSGGAPPRFNASPGHHTQDGAVVWIPIGGTGIPGTWQGNHFYPAIGTVSNNDSGSSICEPSGLNNGLLPGQVIYWQVSSGGISGPGPSNAPGYNGNFKITGADVPANAMQITYQSPIAGLVPSGGGTATIFIGEVYPLQPFTIPDSLQVTINGATNPAWDGTYDVLPIYKGQTIAVGSFLEIILSPNQYSALPQSGGGFLQAAIEASDIKYLERIIYVYFYNLLDELSPPYTIDYIPGSGTNSTGGSTVPPANYDIVFNLSGLPPTGATFLAITFDRPVTWPADLFGSQGTALNGSTDTNLVFVVSKNGTPVAEFIFNGTAATFQSAGVPVVWAIGDQMTVTCPSPADATLGNLSVTFKGSTTG